MAETAPSSEIPTVLYIFFVRACQKVGPKKIFHFIPTPRSIETFALLALSLSLGPVCCLLGENIPKKIHSERTKNIIRWSKLYPWTRMRKNVVVWDVEKHAEMRFFHLWYIGWLQNCWIKVESIATFRVTDERTCVRVLLARESDRDIGISRMWERDKEKSRHFRREGESKRWR